MSWSRLSSKITLLNHTKILQFLSHQSRFLPNALYPSYKFFKASTGCGNNAWGLMPRCEFSTMPPSKSFDFCPYGPRSLVFAMVGSSYAAIPLYRRFCQATGYGGTVQRRESVEEKIVRHEKDGTVATRCAF
ncbi:hypothetical protein CRYUN_Cryun11dG0111200 [Craigia yunnanensis]